MATMIIKVKDLLKRDLDIDIGNDFSDEFITESGISLPAEIAFVGPCELTDEGKDHFKNALELDVEISDDSAIVKIPESDSDSMDKMLSEVMMLFHTLAGLVSVKYFDKYVKEN